MDSTITLDSITSNSNKIILSKCLDSEFIEIISLALQDILIRNAVEDFLSKGLDNVV